MAERVDVTIVGGGIQGVGVAQAAAAAGYEVTLLEQTALGAGTSSKSSKLIHGGLRYLEQRQMSVVRMCLRERALLLRLAPTLVRLRNFHLPIFEKTSRRPLTIRVGLSVYALLGGLSKSSRFTTIPRDRWETLDGLTTDGLECVFAYQDAQTDDQLLTAAVMHSAQTLGARLLMPARLIAARRGADGWRVEYDLGGGSRTLETTLLINAAGPWAPMVQKLIHDAPPPRPVELVQGAHLVIEGSVEQGMYYVESPHDRRAVFVMPWQGRTLVGTTETPYSGDPAACAATEEETTYLRAVFDRYFPGRSHQPTLDAFAGLRVLPGGGGRAFDRSRETIIDVDDKRRPRLVTLYGGKLTAYRAVSERVVTMLGGAMRRVERRAATAELPLTAPAAQDVSPPTR